MLAGSMVIGPAAAEEGATGAPPGTDLTALSKKYRAMAEKGDGESAYRLGVHYSLGWGVAQDHARAATWYYKAAQQGVLAAMSDLGDMYAIGKGVPKNIVAAYAWFTLAVEDVRFPPSARARTARKRSRIAKHLSAAERARAVKMVRTWRAARGAK